jgi:hypothetical protein
MRNVERAWCCRVGAIALLLMATGAQACPVCNSATGAEVRAGILDGRFLQNLLLAGLPFPVIVALVAMIYFGFPRGWWD